jgi:hypothetical protein
MYRQRKRLVRNEETESDPCLLSRRREKEKKNVERGVQSSSSPEAGSCRDKISNQSQGDKTRQGVTE